MQFSKTIMNPPYNNGLGGKITNAVLELTDEISCLMPLSNYKNKSAELWRYVDSFELADPNLFKDAVITKNLCICSLKNNFVDKYSYYELEHFSFQKEAMAFFEKNNKHFFEVKCKPVHLENFTKENTFIVFSRAIDGRPHRSNLSDYRWNVEKTLERIPTYLEGGRVRSSYDTLSLSGKAHINFGKWWYNNDGLGLPCFLLKSLNKNGGNMSSAIPQIDWENISENPLWKSGDYDGAVLDVMGLMWVDGVIVRKSTN